MTLSDFLRQYYFHDSSIEKIDFNIEHKILTIRIDFCFWMQPWYKQSEDPANALIDIIFENVSLFEYNNHLVIQNFSEKCDNEIRDVVLDTNDCLQFVIANSNDDNDLLLFKIKAIDVRVINLQLQ